MSPLDALFWSLLIVGGITFAAIAGALLVRRWVTVEVLERHNDVAGFIYAVIGVLYAVLLGFTAIIVWERFDEAQTNVERAEGVPLVMWGVLLGAGAITIGFSFLFGTKIPLLRP
jgi:hypothetical protein